MDLTLQEVLIVGNNNDQVKFSELTLDMFRILQTLEREPQEEASYQAYSLPTRTPSMVCRYGCYYLRPSRGLLQLPGFFYATGTE